MPKQSLCGNAAREALQRGLDKVADSVKQTLGPRGRNVLLERHGQPPHATRDGVTVAKECANLPEPFENMGAWCAREVADAAVVEAGDGTTTATVILQAIVREGLKLVSAGAEPLLLADGIKLAAASCAEYIKKLAIPATPELVRQAAIISTHGDIALGTLIAEATCKVGANGVLELQESKDETTSVEHLEGFYFERGWRPHQFFAKDTNGTKCVLKNPLILISERVIVGAGIGPNSQIIAGDGLAKIVQIAVQARRPLLIVAEELTGDAMNLFAANIHAGQLVGGCYVKLPGFGEHRAPAIEDLRIAVGAKRVHSQTSTRIDDQLSSFTIDDLGWCEQAVISPMMTVLINGGANEMVLNKRVKDLINQSQEEANPYAKEQLDHRIARLTGGVAVLRVGEQSEQALNEKKARAEDAIHCCRGALQEGIVPGGGVALLRASQNYAYTAGQPGFSDGQKILVDAIREPAKQIFRNAGFDVDTMYHIIAGLNGSLGCNAALGTVGDLYTEGIVDPAKVVITALTKAASIGALLLTTEVLVSDIPEPKQEMAPPRAY